MKLIVKILIFCGIGYAVVIGALILLSKSNKDLISNEIPKEYLSDVSKDNLDFICLGDFDYITSNSKFVQPITSLFNKCNTYFYILKIYKGSHFEFNILSKNFTTYNRTEFENQFSNNIYHNDLIETVNNLQIEVERFTKINEEFYQIRSKTFTMIQDQKYKTLGYFEVGEFYLQIKDKQDYIVLNIFYADNEKDLHYLKNVLM